MQVVDVIERCAGLDQAAHDLDMAKMRRRDQRGAVIGAGRQSGIVAEFDRQRHELGIVGDRGDRDHVIGASLERVHVRPGLGERPKGGVLRREGSDMGGRAPPAIAGVDVRARGR